MSDEPQTRYYPTGFVQRARLRDRAVLAEPGPATAVAEVPQLRADDALRAQPIRVSLPRSVRVASWIALGAALVACAYVAGQRSSLAPEPRPALAAQRTSDEAGRREDGKDRRALSASAPPAAMRHAPSEPRASANAGAQAVASPLRDAVQALASGEYNAALHAYRALAAAHPSEDAYAVIAGVLERRLAARCATSRAGGSSCAAR